MSTTPPPPPFGYTPPGSTTGSPHISALPSRADLRTQRQAAQAQGRWQRDQARIQLRSRQRSSAVGPLLLVAAGIVLLLLQTGRLAPGATLLWFSAWWPAILIGAGVILLGEWAVDRRAPNEGTALTSRRVLGGLPATALFLIAASGVGLTAVRRSVLGDQLGQQFGNPAWDRTDLGRQMTRHGLGGWEEIFGKHQEFTESLQATLSPTGELTVEDPHGDVTVTGSSEDGQVHVTVHQRLLVLQSADLNRRHLEGQPQFRGDREHLTLAAASDSKDDVDLTITVPHDATLVVRSGTGDVSVEEIHGATTIGNQSGDVKLTALRGPVHLSSASDDTTITAHSLGGGLALEGRSGDITLSDIEGGVALHGDFFGTTQMERIHGPVRFQSSFTRLDCGGIPGSLVVEGRSDLTAHRLEGPLTLTTSDRNLSIDGVRGPANITDRNGSVDLTLASPQPLQINNANGDINVSVPEHMGFTVQAQATEGEIQNDLGLISTKTEATEALKGKILGGGPTISLQTTNEDIKLSRVARAATLVDDDTGLRSPAPPQSPKFPHQTHQPHKTIE